MEMSNMLKTFGKHLLIPYAIILVINIILLIIGCVIDVTLTFKICYYLLSINIIFSFMIGYILYGSYGRTFALIQNNKTSFVISSLLFVILNSILLTLFVFLFGIIIYSYSINLLRIFLLFCLYLGVAYLGCLYGLVVKNKKVIKLFFMIIVLGLCFVFLNYFSETIMSLFSNIMLDDNNNKFLVNNLIWFGSISIILSIICNTLYLKLNIAKVYSAE